jgi:hypothetical protein
MARRGGGADPTPFDERELGGGLALDVVHDVIGHGMKGPTTPLSPQRGQHPVREGVPSVLVVGETPLLMGGIAHVVSRQSWAMVFVGDVEDDSFDVAAGVRERPQRG